MLERRSPCDIPSYPDVTSVGFEEVAEGGALRFGFTAGNSDPDLYMAKRRLTIPEENRTRLKDLYWFFNDYWKNKGIPKEQFTIAVPGLDHPINLYNYANLLTQVHIQELKEVIGYFCQAYNGEAIKDLRYILVDDVQDFNDLSQEPTYGAMPTDNLDGRMLLYPRALEPLPFKRIPSVSGLKATVVHEFAHRLTRYLFDEWVSVPDFDWINTRAEQGQGYLYRSCYVTSNPETCVTSYAVANPDEDIAESMIACWGQLEILHPEKLRILREKVGVIGPVRNDIEVKRYSGNDITLPTMDKITYMFIQRDKKVA